MSSAIASLLLGNLILFVGDSITQGADPGLGYVERIAADNADWDVVNVGCPGASTLDWTLPKNPDSPDHCSFRGAFDLLAAPYVDADVVHILLGTNDALGFGEYSMTQPFDYIDNIDELASRFSGDVIVSLPPPVPDADSALQALLDQYIDELLARAGQPDVGFRLGADFSRLDRTLLDGVHPTNEGHAWMASQLNVFLVPEPSAAGLLVFGLCCLVAERRLATRGALHGA